MALAVVVFDQAAKYLVEQNLPLGRSVPVLGEVLSFLYVKNPGAAFSLAGGYTWIFSIAAAAVTMFIIMFARRIRSTTWAVLFGMLLGGTVGNLIDRLFREPSFGVGHVVDFIQVIYFPAIFNIADSFIVASMGLFVILTIRGVGLDGTRVQPADARREPMDVAGDSDRLDDPDRPASSAEQDPSGAEPHSPVRSDDGAERP